MAVDKTTLPVTELDFDTIKFNLKQFLRSQSEFTDYDFDGSGMSVLLDILAYNTHYMSYYMNMIGNEMFLDTAQLRSSILSHAKSINYIPASRQGALARINVKITPSLNEDQELNSLTLDKYTKLFSADKDGVNYSFVTLYSNTTQKTANNTFEFSNIWIKQGDVITIQYLIDPLNTSQRFEIPSQNVDTTSILVDVQESSSNTDTSTYILGEDITTITSNSKVYFLEENESLKYTLYFGDGIIGKKLKNGNIVTVTYLDNLGQSSNNISQFLFSEPIGRKYSSNVIVNTIATSSGGQEKETIEEVRFRAPYFYTTQNRAVTKNDYQTLIKKDYKFIDSISVWGGEENDPVIYGKVFISIKPKGNYQLTNLEKERIKNEITRQRGILTVTPEILDPDYVYLMIRGKVYYDSKLTSLTASEINNYIRAAIQDYNANELNNFNSIYRRTRLEQYIENCNPAITACDIKVLAQKRVKTDPTRKRTYTFDYKFNVQHSEEDRLSSYPSAQIYDNLNNMRDAFFEEIPSADTGISEIILGDGGQNYTESPNVIISGDGSGATATAKVLAGRVQSITVTNAGENYSYAVAIISGGNGTGATVKTVKLQIETGTLRSYYYKENGEKVILSNDAGSVYYSTGLITLNATKIFSVTENAFYDDGYLTMTALIKDSVLYGLRNRILTIDEGDPRSILIDVIAE